MVPVWDLENGEEGDRRGTRHPCAQGGMSSVHACALSLTAGTSGPPDRTCAHRSQSEATGSEAASSPASPWWPRPGSSGEAGEEVRKSHEVQRAPEATNREDPKASVGRGHRRSVEVTAIHPPLGLCYLLNSSLVIKGERILYECYE